MKRTKAKIFRALIITAIIITIIFIALFVLVLTNKGKVIRGLKIANISIGGLERNDAYNTSLQLISPWLKKDVALRYEKEEKIWTTPPEKLGIIIDLDSTLNKAIEIGHRENLLPNLAQQILAFLGYYNLKLDYRIDETQLENFIKQELDSIDAPAVDAGWKYNEQIDDFVQIPSQQGIIINRQNLKSQLHEKAKKLTRDDIFLILINDYPEISEDKTIQAYDKAKEILNNAPYTLTPAQTLLTKEELIPMIEFRGVDATLNAQSLRNYLIALSPSISRDPIDAQFKIEGNRVVEFTLSQDGTRLEIEKNVLKLQEEIFAGNKEIKLEISIAHPKIATKDINNLGITSLVGKGVSNFAGSPNNRIHNIKIGTAKFHGVLIKPNEEFSFNTILGEVGPEQGYKAELVIKKDKTIPEYGGGLCQVSTTAFRTAVYSGLKITERSPHAFPVKYYSPQGFDATIYPPHPDLRFMNNTPGHLLIQTKINGSELIFEFYGANDNRRVEVKGPFQYDIKADGSMKAQLVQEVYDKDGDLIEDKTFYSNYKSPNLYPVQRNPLE